MRAAAPAAAPAKGEKVAPPPPPPFNPAKQVGALAPLGFFDPLGFCKVWEPQNLSPLLVPGFLGA
eukprot:210423-Heterocapsa_arctica.AAC.1